MRRKMILLVLSLVFILGLAGCESSNEDTYYIALYQVIKSTYDVLSGSVTPDDNLSYIKTQQPGIQPIESKSGFTIDEVKNYFRQYPTFTEASISNHVNNLEQRGSTQAFLVNQTAGTYYYLFIKRE